MPAGAVLAMHAVPPAPKWGNNPMRLSKAMLAVGSGGLGAVDPFDASTKAAANGNDALIIDIPVIKITPNFSLSTSGLWVIGQFSNAIDIIGLGSHACYMYLNGTLVIDPSKITGTNPFHTWLISGGSGRTVRGFGFDGRYKANLWATLFNGWRINSAANLLLADVPHPGIHGTDDLPPGEVHNGLVWGSNNVTVRDITTDGEGIAATLYAFNKTTNPTFRNIAVVNSGQAHGFSHYESLGTVNIINCVSMNNKDAGLNNEETNQDGLAKATVVVDGLYAAGNAYDVRHENGFNGGGQDNDSYTIKNSTLKSTPVSIRRENNQITDFILTNNTMAGTNVYVPQNPGRVVTTHGGATLTGTQPTTSSPGTGSLTNTATGRQATSIGTSTVYDEYAATSDNWAVALMFHTPTALPNASLRFGDCVVSGTSKLRIFMTATGLLQLQDSTGVNLFLSAAALSLNTDYWIQLYVQRSAGLVTFTHYLGDQCTTPVEAGISALANANLGAANFTAFRFGQCVSNAFAGSVWLKKLGINTQPTGRIGWFA